MSLIIAATFFVAMVAAALLVEAIFQALHLVPTARNAQIVEASIHLNYTTVLNLLFLALSAVLVWRFLRTGGPTVLAMMDKAPEGQAEMARDPVCGMQVDPRSTPEHAELAGRTYYFCSASCRAQFEREPERYVGTHAA